MSGARVTGVFGKLASQGDFVTRRLPADFVRAWDRWSRVSGADHPLAYVRRMLVNASVT